MGLVLSRWWAMGIFELMWMGGAARHSKRGRFVRWVVRGARSNQKRMVRSVVVGGCRQGFQKRKLPELVEERAPRWGGLVRMLRVSGAVVEFLRVVGYLKAYGREGGESLAVAQL